MLPEPQAGQVIERLRVVRVDRYGALIVFRCRIGPAQRLRSPPHEPQHRTCRHRVGLQGHRQCQGFERFLVALQAEQGIAHGGVGQRVVGVDLQHGAVVLDRFLVAALLAECYGGVVQGGGSRTISVKTSWFASAASA